MLEVGGREGWEGWLFGRDAQLNVRLLSSAYKCAAEETPLRAVQGGRNQPAHVPSTRHSQSKILILLYKNNYGSGERQRCKGGQDTKRGKKVFF